MYLLIFLYVITWVFVKREFIPMSPSLIRSHVDPSSFPSLLICNPPLPHCKTSTHRPAGPIPVYTYNGFGIANSHAFCLTNSTRFQSYPGQSFVLKLHSPMPLPGQYIGILRRIPHSILEFPKPFNDFLKMCMKVTRCAVKLRGFWELLHVLSSSLQYPTEPFRCPKHFPEFLTSPTRPPLWTPGKHPPVSHLHSLAFTWWSYSWNHTLCRFSRLASFT